MADNKNTMKLEEIRRILEKGILAPSADNLQPWKFRILDNRIDFYLDSNRVKNFCDEGLSVPYISAGAVIENMRIAATQFGCYISTSYFPEKTNPLMVAIIRFSETKKENHPQLETLSKRTTNRKFYKVWQKIDPSIYTTLSKIADSEQRFKLLWVERNHSSYSKLSSILGKSDQLRFESERLHKELFETLRFSKEMTEKTKDGLDLKTFEAGLMGNLLFKLAGSWERLKFLNAIGLTYLFNFYTQLQMRSSQAAGLLIAKSNEPLDYVLGGEMMQRLWHEITILKLSIQPMEALPIFIINLRLTGGRDFTASQRKKIEELKQKFLLLFRITEQNGLIFFFRIGYAPSPTTHSLRRPLEHFLL